MLASIVLLLIQYDCGIYIYYIIIDQKSRCMHVKTYILFDQTGHCIYDLYYNYYHIIRAWVAITCI